MIINLFKQEYSFQELCSKHHGYWLIFRLINTSDWELTPWATYKLVNYYFLGNLTVMERGVAVSDPRYSNHSDCVLPLVEIASIRLEKYRSSHVRECEEYKNTGDNVWLPEKSFLILG